MLLLAVQCLVGCGYLYRKIGGDFEGEPEELATSVSPMARSLIDQAFSGLDPERLADIHLHLIGNGVIGSGLASEYAAFQLAVWEIVYEKSTIARVTRWIFSGGIRSFIIFFIVDDDAGYVRC